MATHMYAIFMHMHGCTMSMMHMHVCSVSMMQMGMHECMKAGDNHIEIVLIECNTILKIKHNVALVMHKLYR
jgi:hypothetical protein